MQAAVLALTFAAVLGPAVGSDVLLKPMASKAGRPQLGVVMVQGTQIEAKAYVPLLSALQNELNYEAWVSVPAFIGNIPEPLQFGSKMSSAMKQMHAAGLDESAPIAVLAHSLGGVFLQDYTFKCKSCPVQILMGATLLRKYRNGSKGTGDYPVPTLMLDGTLDGLMRVTRQAESFYHYSAKDNFPVVIYEGTSHMQFASGPPPANVKSNDLKPTVPDDEAHKMMATTMSNFIAIHVGGSGVDQGAATAALEKEKAATATIMKPIVEALQMEANPHLKPPCNSDYPMPSCPFYPRFPGKQRGDTPQENCACGTPWSQEFAQVVMTGLGNVKVVTTDAVHAVSDLNPIHLPKIWSPNCALSNDLCTINVTTVTQPIYSKLDAFDTGFSYESASELRVKLKSRQTMWMASGRKNVNFTQTDETGSICADINRLAYEWALNHSSATARSLYDKIGEKMEMGADLGPYNAGPLWIYNPLKYIQAKDKSKVVVQAPMMRTPSDYKIKAAAGFHYCKLLSPARALEWIYIDGLRAKGGL